MFPTCLPELINPARALNSVANLSFHRPSMPRPAEPRSSLREEAHAVQKPSARCARGKREAEDEYMMRAAGLWAAQFCFQKFKGPGDFGP